MVKVKDTYVYIGDDIYKKLPKAEQKKFKELYEEIMQQMKPKKSQLRSFSPQTFSRMIQENFEEERVTPKLNLFSDVT